MRRRITAVLAFALLAAPAAAHVGERASEDVQPGMFGQRPIALVAQQQAALEVKATPPAKCTAGSRPEPSIQGRLPKEEVDSGRAADGYWCNLTRVGKSGATGGFKVLRYVDENGHECAYYDTTLLFPTNTLNLSMDLTGVAVLDMSDPAKPVRTDSLLTPAMQSPHESVNISVQRGLLAAVAGNPAFAPGIVDVYDISKDCRKPVLQSSAPVGFLGHESGMAPDGRTFYSTSIGSGQTTAVDITNPKVPLPIWQGQYDSHGMTLSDDGNRGYLAAGSGLIILDLSEVQARKPNPQVREISRLVWPNMTIPQVAHPVTIKGKPYLVEVDEYSNNGDGGSVSGNGSVVGAARIIDIADETKPKVVSEIRLQVHQPESRAELAGDYGARNPTQGYAAHYCNVPQRVEPGIFACSMILSGLRVFDIRDPLKPKEIAYHYAPPSTVSETGGPVIDERANWAMSQPAFVPERGEIWYSDGTSGFYALKMDERVWPFKNLRTASGCTDNRGLAGVGARSLTGGAVQLRFTRRAKLPVRVDVFRVSKGRRVIKERRVARFDDRSAPFVWRARGAGAGYYFARFTMLKDGRAYDTRRLVLQRSGSGTFTRRDDHFRRDSCGLLGKFKLERPVFGGPGDAALTAAYRLSTPAQVTITVSRGSKVVKRFATISQPANRTIRVRLGARGLRRGDYTVRMSVVRGDEQVSAKLVARRL
jgi:hypothetical protein